MAFITKSDLDNPSVVRDSSEGLIPPEEARKLAEPYSTGAMFARESDYWSLVAIPEYQPGDPKFQLNTYIPGEVGPMSLIAGLPGGGAALADWSSMMSSVKSSVSNNKVLTGGVLAGLALFFLMRKK